MRKKVGANPNFFKATGGGMSDGDFVVGADRFQPPAQGAPGQAQAAVNGNTQDRVAAGGSKSLIACYKRAKTSGAFILQSNGLKTFPAELANFAEFTIPGENWWDGCELTKIDVSNNEIPEIPEDLSKQDTIQHLNVNSNKLQQIPGALFALPNLKFLDVSYNNLKCLPEALGQA